MHEFFSGIYLVNNTDYRNTKQGQGLFLKKTEKASLVKESHWFKWHFKMSPRGRDMNKVYTHCKLLKNVKLGRSKDGQGVSGGENEQCMLCSRTNLICITNQKESRTFLFQSPNYVMLSRIHWRQSHYWVLPVCFKSDPFLAHIRFTIILDAGSY